MFRAVVFANPGFGAETAGVAARNVGSAKSLGLGGLGAGEARPGLHPPAPAAIGTIYYGGSNVEPASREFAALGGVHAGACRGDRRGWYVGGSRPSRR